MIPLKKHIDVFVFIPAVERWNETFDLNFHHILSWNLSPKNIAILSSKENEANLYSNLKAIKLA